MYVKFYSRDNKSVISWISWIAQSIKQCKPAKYTHCSIVIDNTEYSMYFDSQLMELPADKLTADTYWIPPWETEEYYKTNTDLVVADFVKRQLKMDVVNLVTWWFYTSACTCVGFVSLCTRVDIKQCNTVDRLFKELPNSDTTT